ASGEPGVRVPGFWDPRRRPEKPDLSRISVIRFLTETDYPLFNFAGPDGNPQGDSFWGRRAADPWWATPSIRTNLSSRKPQAAVCRQSISDSWLGNLRECLAHLVSRFRRVALRISRTVFSALSGMRLFIRAQAKI